VSNQSPSTNSRDQQGPDVANREQHRQIQDESGFTSGIGEPSDEGRPSSDIDETDDPSKD
jgi:hypothetical protein